MRWKVLSIALLAATTLAPVSVVIGQPPAEAGPTRPGEGSATRIVARQQAQQIQELERRIEDLKADHQQLIGELRSLHQVAIKEEARETAGTIERLITKLQGSFQEKVAQLQRQRQRLQVATRVRPPRTGRTERQGRRAPDFTLSSFDGRTFSLTDLKGKTIVLEWINLECPFSMYHYKTADTMIDLAQKYKDKNVVWLAVNSTNHTTAQTNIEFAKEQKLPYPILDDRSGRVGRLYGAKTTPHVFIVDPAGYIAYDGAIDSAPMGQVAVGSRTVNYVDQALAQMATDQEITTPSTPPYGCSVKYPSR